MQKKCKLLTLLPVLLLLVVLLNVDPAKAPTAPLGGGPDANTPVWISNSAGLTVTVHPSNLLGNASDGGKIPLANVMDRDVFPTSGQPEINK